VAGRWRSSEDTRLRQLYAAGAPLAVIAIELGRSADAINARRTALGLAPRRRTRDWSPLADSLLREATRAGVPATVLARRLHRPVEQLRARRRQLGLDRPPARRYTSDDDAAIRALWTSGGDLDELARELGRTPDALRLRARRLGLHCPARRRRWTDTEDATLRDGYADGLTCDEIARALTQRTPTAVAARAHELGLASYARRWSPEDDSRLSHALSLHTIDDVARALVRTPEAIRRRARKLGLDTNPPPLRRPRAGARWTPEDDEFLCLHAALNPALLATLLGRSDHAVVARLRRTGLRVGRERSPHHPSPTNGGLSPGERALLDRELRDRGDRAVLVLEHRLGRDGAALRRVAGRPVRPRSGTQHTGTAGPERSLPRGT
jgi:hypothetical protein